MNKVIFLFFSFSVGISFSQNTMPEKKTDPAVTPVVKRDKSKISNRIKMQFEEDLVKGQAESTELNFLQSRQDANFKKMIKIRDNFIPEVEESVSELGAK